MLDPIDLVTREIGRLNECSIGGSLDLDDVKKLEALIRCRALLLQNPSAPAKDETLSAVNSDALKRFVSENSTGE